MRRWIDQLDGDIAGGRVGVNFDFEFRILNFLDADGVLYLYPLEEGCDGGVGGEEDVSGIGHGAVIPAEELPVATLGSGVEYYKANLDGAAVCVPTTAVGLANAGDIGQDGEGAPNGVGRQGFEVGGDGDIGNNGEGKRIVGNEVSITGSHAPADEAVTFGRQGLEADNAAVGVATSAGDGAHRTVAEHGDSAPDGVGRRRSGVEGALDPHGVEGDVAIGVMNGTDVVEGKADCVAAIGAEVDSVVGPMILHLGGVEAAVGLGVEDGGELGDGVASGGGDLEVEGGFLTESMPVEGDSLSIGGQRNVW